MEEEEEVDEIEEEAEVDEVVDEPEEDEDAIDGGWDIVLVISLPIATVSYKVAWGRVQVG